MGKRSLAKRLLAKPLLLGCVCSALHASALAYSQPDEKQANEEHALYLQRYDALRDIFQTGKLGDLYDPLGVIHGADEPTALPRAKNDLISPATVKTAIDYAEARNSAAFWIIKDGAVIVEEYFKGTTPETLLISRSLSKPLGVLSVGRAIERGHINGLDQSASDFITEWKGTPKQAITIRHLLDMRSGLARQERGSGPDSVMLKAYLHPRHDEIIINDYPLVTEPGTDYGYANANSELIAPIIERATGKTFEHWLAREILAPLAAPGGKIWLNREGGTAHSGCCAKLPMESWAKIALFVLNDGVWNGRSLLPPDFVGEMKTPTPQNPFAGMGLYLGADYIEQRGAGNPSRSNMPTTYHSEPYASPDLFLFDGNANQVIYFIPLEDLIIIRLGDAPPEDAPWDNAYLPNLILRDLKNNAGRER